MDLTANEILLAVLSAAGIPSAIVGLLIWKLQRRIELRDQEEKEREHSREKLELLIIKGNGAAIALAEATARAVERIPDTNCNGDMHSALQYATDVKHDIKEFLEEQSVRAIIN